MPVRAFVAVLVLALLGLGGWGAYAWFTQSPDNQFESLRAGDCIRLLDVPGVGPAPDGTLTVRHEEADCAEGPTPMTYTVGVVGPGQTPCPNGDYVEYYQVSTSRTAGQNTREHTACLVPNFEPDLCYGEDDSTLGYQVVPCGQGALLHVDSVTSDPSQTCRNGARKLSFPHPPRLFCVRPPA
ncbi:hypothetical protein CGZ93_16145 [Enemella dayhoffiae]|uniref:Uncharacterized protein n=1 Tax=Enemella dayhoffiae TaxID=2016507 RepID=A0A255GQI3_9ACTN|nr:hypothetical protein [Enemella dayhoffiae]OYO18087.1 hypothetical protein CGZ93_16145 [Enemella dayhoffiae]